MARELTSLLEDLVARRDTRQAQEELYQLVSSHLLEPLRSRIPLRARSRLDAEDVLHEALIRALENIPEARCKTEAQFLAWVYRIARNLMTDQAKRMSAQAVPFAQAGAKIARGPETAIQRKELIENVLGELNETEADVIRRRWLNGQTFEEIASALHKTRTAAKSLYTRAWKRFRQIAHRKN
jgi:RNA polymerase sigma factor (sigma-70 family)